MPERDPQFEQEVRRIIYEALADREALAAAMAVQQPTPVPDDALGEPSESAPSRSGPWETGVQGGAPDSYPRNKAFCCCRTLHIDYEDLWLGDDPLEGDGPSPEEVIESIANDSQTTREEVMQELMRRALTDHVQALRAAVAVPDARPKPNP